MSTELVLVLIMIIGAVALNIMIGKSKQSKSNMKDRKKKYLKRLQDNYKD